MQGLGTQLDQQPPSNVEMTMKAQNDLSLWSIIERLQRRLERQGLSAAAVDRSISIALRTLATAR